MKIVVLCGGLSGERDVSITSGTGVARALRERGHQVVLVDLFLGIEGDIDNIFEDNNTISDYSVSENAPDLDEVRAMRADSDVHIGTNVIELCRRADIAFLALHGEEGENGKLQAALDMYGVKYTGSGYLGSALAMNKSLSKTLFEANGIKTAPGITLHKGEEDYPNVGFPCVVKPCSGGSSVGTSVVNCEEEYAPALEFAFKYEEDVLVEKFIKAREVTVGVMDGKAMEVIEIIPKSGFYDYKNKYQAGATIEICPAEIGEDATRRVKALGEKAMSALMVDAYCRADFLWDTVSDEIYCLEVNTLPGMTPTSLIPQMAACDGLNYGELCEKIIEISLKKYE